MKALLVVDVQNITLGSKHNDYFNYKQDLVIRINKLIKEYDNENVYYIKNIMKKNLFNKLSKIKCYDNTHESDFADNLNVVSNKIFKKHKGNAFSNKDLEKTLQKNKIEEIDIVGVDFAGCVALTAAGAIKRGYRVRILENYTDTIFKSKIKNINNNLNKMGIEIDKFN